MERSLVSLLIILGATIGGGANALLASNMEPAETTQIVHAAPNGLITTPLHQQEAPEESPAPTAEPARSTTRISFPVNQTPTPAPAANGTTTIDNKDGIHVDGCDLSGKNNGRDRGNSCDGDENCIVHRHHGSDVECDEGRVR